MKKYLLFVMLVIWPFLVNAQEWVTQDSAGTILSGLSDKDTILVVFSAGLLPKQIAMDTTKNARTANRPPDFVRAAGDCDLFLDRLNMTGTADSFRVYYKIVHPHTGRLARNDSTFILGTASTFANFTSDSRYTITLPVCKGFALVLQKGDGGTPGNRTRVVATVVFSQ